MAVDIGHLKTVAPMSRQELEAMHTGSLLARLARLRSLDASFELSDWDEEELRAVEAAGLIPFKDSPLWEPAVAEVRAVLATREHRPRGSREKRQQAARGRTPR